ncbi:probable plastidic glucose transporter 1 isoform X3 [Coffea arabica]|uniref:Probable plastidic glucose transporter 1 isoform X3 n=1 Tax=Coffea arabica TaxID=13443 RepID=A0ABM4UI07_COFAR
MLETTTTSALHQHQNFPLLSTAKSTPVLVIHNYNLSISKKRKNPCFHSLSCSDYKKRLQVSATRKQQQEQQEQQEEQKLLSGLSDQIWNGKKSLQENGSDEATDLGWLPAFPYALFASMFNFLFGYHIGVMNGPIVSVAKELGFEGNSFLEGLVVSTFIGGAFVGSISSGFLVDKLGCRRAFQGDTIPLVLGAIISAQAHSLDEILWGRFLVGLGVGVNTVLVPIYISEVADNSIYCEHPRVYSGDWNAICCRKSSLAMQVAFIGGALFLLQQFAGVNGVLFFSSLTFADVGITNSALASLCVGFTDLAGALNATYLMEKQGRKSLLIGSYLGMTASMLLVVSAISLPVEKDIGNTLSVLGTTMYIFFFASGAGPVTGLIIPELSSTRTRGKIMSFSLAVHWVCNFLVGQFFLELAEKFGVASVYAGFGGFSLMAATFGYYFTVETKGRSLEEIEMSLNPNFLGGNK